MSTSAWAAQKPVSVVAPTEAHSTGEMNLTAGALSAIEDEKTATFFTESGSYITLGSQYFANPSNQGITLRSSLGTCVTDNQGCWSSSTGEYVPVVLDQTKLFKYLSEKNKSTNYSVKKAGWGNTTLGIVGLVGAVAAGAALIVSLPISGTVVGVATAVGLVAAVVGGGITACQNLAGRCK
jgi:hypothetical protein